VKKNDLTKGIIAALLLASPMAWAESQYPAADFEPKIISQDADLIAKHNQAAKERAATEQAGARANNSAKQSQPSTTAPASTEQSKPDAAVATSDSTGNFPVILIVLALGGLVFWTTKRSGSTAQEAQSAYTGLSGSTAPAGETGVAKYLKSLPASARGETGVAKYLKSLPVSAKAAETGVAKYLKNLPASAKATVAETGVAKYLKSLPASAKATVAETGVAKYLKSLPASPKTTETGVAKYLKERA
jgi:hypothetical protein